MPAVHANANRRAMLLLLPTNSIKRQWHASKCGCARGRAARDRHTSLNRCSGGYERQRGSVNNPSCVRVTHDSCATGQRGRLHLSGRHSAKTPVRPAPAFTWAAAGCAGRSRRRSRRTTRWSPATGAPTTTRTAATARPRPRVLGRSTLTRRRASPTGTTRRPSGRRGTTPRPRPRPRPRPSPSPSRRPSRRQRPRPRRRRPSRRCCPSFEPSKASSTGSAPGPASRPSPSTRRRGRGSRSRAFGGVFLFYVALLASSSGERYAPLRHRADVVSTAWRSTR